MSPLTKKTAAGAQHNLGGYDPNNPPDGAECGPVSKESDAEPDDEKVACFLYPVTEYTCSQNTDCPLLVDDDSSGQEYYVGQVSVRMGSVAVFPRSYPKEHKTGEGCASDFDCVDPLFCQPTGTGQSVCIRTVIRPQTAADSTCFPQQRAVVCLPTPGSGRGGGTSGGPVATKANGDQCNSSVECQSGLCVGGASGTTYCRAPCTVGGSECPAGEACFQLQGSANGACIPQAGGSGSKAPGALCTSPSECISLCIGPTDGGYYCREGCEPALGNCPELFACAHCRGGACIPTNPKLGLAEPCEFGDDCQAVLYNCRGGEWCVLQPGVVSAHAEWNAVHFKADRTSAPSVGPQHASLVVIPANLPMYVFSDVCGGYLC